MTSELILRWSLRLIGATCTLATVAMVMPTPWMDYFHRMMGLGAFPDFPVTQYLARSASGLYAFMGVLMIALSLDVRRYLPVLTVMAVCWVVFGVAVMIIDFRTGMPADWTWGEGLNTIGIGLAMLILCRRIARGAADAERNAS